MTLPAIHTTIDHRGVATLTLNRPDIHNAFDDLLIEAMTAELKNLEQNKQVRVVVLAAAGKSFSAGADLAWMRRMADYSYEENLTDIGKLSDLMQTLSQLHQPTIARVQGAAYGGGVGLVACCDMAIASDRAVFCLSEVKLGLIPAVISPYVVAAMGPRAARRYFLSAEAFNASEALRWGLVHEVVADDQLDHAIESLIETLLRNGPIAMAAAKQLIERVSFSPLDTALIQTTAERIANIRASAEGKEGLSAFLEKRPAAWVKG